MPVNLMPAINRAFREFRRYTGDGLPGEPVSAALPVGDPASGVHNPPKSEIRGAFLDVEDAINAGVADLDDAVSDAEAAAAAAADSAGDAASLNPTLGVNYATLTSAAATSIPPSIQYLRTAGRLAVGDGGSALYQKAVSEPSHALKFQSADSAWWGSANKEVVDIRELRWGGAATAAEQAQSLNDAIAYLGARGGGEIYIPPGSYDINAQIVLANNSVRIRGAGVTGDTDYVSQVWATRLRWTGASSASMIYAAPVSGPTSRRLMGVGVSDVFLDGNLLAGRGFEGRSLFNSFVSGVAFHQFSGASGALYLSVVETLGAGEARDLQNCRFESLTIRLLTGEGTSDCIRLDGDAGANTSFNLFKNITLKHSNNQGLVWGNSDNNLLEYFRAFRPVGTGYGMIFSADNELLRTSRSNRSHRVFCQGGVYAQGTGIATHASYNNFMTDYDIENGSPAPVIDTGASLEWWSEYARAKAGVSGAQSMANGMIEQWGETVVPAGNAVTATFPVALISGGGLSATATVKGSGGTSYESPPQAVVAGDGAGVVLVNLNVNDATIAWRVIGRVI
jgi:hypothetical protein